MQVGELSPQDIIDWCKERRGHRHIRWPRRGAGQPDWVTPPALSSPNSQQLLSGKAWAVIDEEQNRVLSCGPEAWRYLGWVGKDENGELRRYPAGIYGWLPEVPD